MNQLIRIGITVALVAVGFVNVWADVLPCVLDVPQSDGCIACLGDDGIAHKCDQSVVSAICFGAAPTGPMVYCFEAPLDCEGDRWEYDSILHCESDMNGMNVGPCNSDYDFAITMTPLPPMGGGANLFCP